MGLSSGIYCDTFEGSVSVLFFIFNLVVNKLWFK